MQLLIIKSTLIFGVESVKKDDRNEGKSPIIYIFCVVCEKGALLSSILK